MHQEHDQRDDHRHQAERESHAFAGRGTGILIDSEGDGLGNAGYIAGDDDGRAEFAQAAGEQQGRTGDQAGHRKGQNHRQQGIVPAGAKGAGGIDQLRINALHADAQGTHQQREAYHRGGDYRGLQSEDYPNACVIEQGAQPPLLAQQEQQEIADHHWWQGQRQINKHFQHDLAAESDKRDQVGDGKTERQRQQGCGERNLD